jgi:NADH-quinone oxidoreductase subunit D
VIILADRLSYAASASWEHTYCITAEDLFGVMVPERAEYIRVMVLEMQRIASHLMWHAAMAADLGNLTLFIYTLRERELFLNLLEWLTGNRLTYCYMRIGGLRNDLPPGFTDKVLKVVNHFEKKVDVYEELFDRDKLVRMRLEDVGVVSRSKAINLGLTGPVLRGSNCQFDVRKDDPYSIYEELDWHVMWEKEGDAYARYRVRLNEYRESCNIIREVIPKIPNGPIQTQNVPARAPEREVFRRTEEPRGEGLMYLTGDGTDKPYRWKIRPQILLSIAASKELLVGYKVADIPAILGTLDVSMGETDR